MLDTPRRRRRSNGPAITTINRHRGKAYNLYLDALEEAHTTFDARNYTVAAQALKRAASALADYARWVEIEERKQVP